MEPSAGWKRRLPSAVPRSWKAPRGKFVTASDAITEYFAAETDRLSRDARRTEKALRRQLRRVAELTERGSATERKVIGAALDAGERARGAAAVASEHAAPAHSVPGHHGSGGHSGCRH